MRGATEILDREVYGVSQAAELLGIRSDKARAWLDGYTRAGRTYPPVVREVSTGSELVTWGEFVELGYLREYRGAGVPLQALRPVISEMREHYRTAYPLAHAKPFVADRDLVVRLQDEHDLAPGLWMVVRTGQLARAAEQFFRKVEFDPNSAASAMAPAGVTSPVRIDPLVSFGMPSVHGVATERLHEVWAAEDQDVGWLAEVYELPLEAVRAGISYEEQRLGQAS